MATPILFILSLAYICYFINDSLIKFCAPKLDTLYLIRRRTYFTVFFSFVWLVISGGWSIPPSPVIFIQVVALAAICSIGLFFFVKANQHLSFPNVIVINLIGLVTQQFIAYGFLREELKSSFPISMLLIVIGVVTLASKPAFKKGVLYAFLSTFFWSMGYALLSIPLKATSVVWTTLIIETVILLLVLFGSKHLIQSEEKNIIPRKSNWLFPAMGLLTVCGSILFNYAYQHYLVSQVSLMYMLFYPLSILVSRLYFREGLSLREWLGNLLILLGITYFQFF